eukprot:3738052-Alexandrium_andersonii.AAC.1
MCIRDRPFPCASRLGGARWVHVDDEAFVHTRELAAVLRSGCGSCGRKLRSGFVQEGVSPLHWAAAIAVQARARGWLARAGVLRR